MEVKIGFENSVKKELAESIIKKLQTIEQSKKFLRALKQANVAVLVYYGHDKAFLYLQKYKKELNQSLYETSINKKIFDGWLIKGTRNYA